MMSWLKTKSSSVNLFINYPRATNASANGNVSDNIIALACSYCRFAKCRKSRIIFAIDFRSNTCKKRLKIYTYLAVA